MPDREVRSRTVSTNGVDLHLLEAGQEGAVVLLAHGFPELAYSWRHQLPALAAAGYRAVAPDQRGYGRSSRPEALEDYDIHHLVGDLVGVLDDLEVSQAVVVGHDWGSMVASHLALLHPERLRGLVEHERAPPLPGRHGAHDGAAQRRRRHVLLHPLLRAGRRRRRARRRSRQDDAPHAGRRGAASRGAARPGPVRQRRAGVRRPDAASPTACRPGCRPPSSTTTSRSSAARLHRRPELVPQHGPQLGDHRRAGRGHVDAGAVRGRRPRPGPAHVAARCRPPPCWTTGATSWCPAPATGSSRKPRAR